MHDAHAVRAGLLLAALGLAACAGAPPPVARTIHGARQVGVFVSPFAYEHFVRAELAAAQGDFATAVELYELARAGAQDDAYVAARQAEALIHAGRLDEAEQTLAEAEAIQPRTERLWLARGELRMARGDAEGAMDAYVEAARVAPASAEAILRIAERLEDLGAAGRALEVLAGGSADHPAVHRARLALALERGDAPAAVDAADALAELVPLALPEVLAAASAALDADRPAMAARLLAHPAVEREPGAVALRVRALLALGQTDAAEALTLSTDAAELGGRGEQARLLLEAGRVEMARDLAAVGVSLSEAGAPTALGWARLELEGPGPAAAAFAREHGAAAADARRGVVRALELGGRPALAREVAGRADVN